MIRADEAAARTSGPATRLVFGVRLASYITVHYLVRLMRVMSLTLRPDMTGDPFVMRLLRHVIIATASSP